MPAVHEGSPRRPVPNLTCDEVEGPLKATGLEFGGCDEVVRAAGVIERERAGRPLALKPRCRSNANNSFCRVNTCPWGRAVILGRLLPAPGCGATDLGVRPSGTRKEHESCNRSDQACRSRRQSGTVQDQAPTIERPIRSAGLGGRIGLAGWRVDPGQPFLNTTRIAGMAPRSSASRTPALVTPEAFCIPNGLGGTLREQVNCYRTIKTRAEELRPASVKRT
jgi:hypothetical protein